MSHYFTDMDPAKPAKSECGAHSPSLVTLLNPAKVDTLVVRQLCQADFHRCVLQLHRASVPGPMDCFRLRTLIYLEIDIYIIYILYISVSLYAPVRAVAVACACVCAYIPRGYSRNA